MFSQGDWVKIEYGDHAGSYAKVAAMNKDGTFRVIPYDRRNEPGAMTDLDEAGLTLLAPYSVSEEEFGRLIRAELMYRDIAPFVFPIFNVKAQQPRRLTAEDIQSAILNINRRDKPLEEFREWFWLIQNIFWEDLQIPQHYREGVFSDMPETEEELFSTVFSLTEDLYWKLEERFVIQENTERFLIRFEEESMWNDPVLLTRGPEETAYRAVCEDIVSRVRTFQYNEGRPEKERVFSPSQKRHIIHSYDSPQDLQKAGNAEKNRYRRFVRDLCELGDVKAMQILAFGYYEGNAVYRQSFPQAEKYLKRLYEKTGDPFAATALGNIYYAGRTNKGVPEYEKAFRFFTYGALAGLDDAIYRSADMLIDGRGTVKNLDTGMNLIVDGYRDSLYRFSAGEYDCRFAEYALRMGEISARRLIYGMGPRDAYKFFLEAGFALDKRMASGALYEDEEVREQIRGNMQKICEIWKPDPDKNLLKADFPIYISHIFEDRYPIKVRIFERDGELYLQMSRFRLIPGEEPKFLVSFPELSYVNLVSELKFALEDVGVIKTPKKEEPFLADGFTKNEQTNALEFYSGGECIAAVEARWFVIDVTKEKMLMKMKQGEN